MSTLPRPRLAKPIALAMTALMSCLLLACSSDPQESTGAATETQATSDFRSFLEANYALDMQQFPQTATRRGIRSNNREWNPQSEAFRQQRRDLWEQRLAALDDFDRSQLSESEDLSWQLYQLELQRNIASDQFRHQKYVIHPHRGPHSQVPSFLINMHKVGTVQDAEDYIARLRAIGPLFDQVIEQLRIREQEGIFLPDWAYPRLIETSRNTISGAPFAQGPDSALWLDFQQKLDALELDSPVHERLLAEARSALLDDVAPAYQRLINEFEHQLPLATAGDGAWKHPDGEAFYAERLRYFTTTDLSAEQIHEIGLREVARIHEEMRGIMAEVGFKGSLGEFMVFMREDPQFYYANDEAGRERYLMEATALIDTMRARLPEAFGLTPEAEIIVKRVEPFRERAAGKAFYQAPPPDGSRPGIYYANLYDMNSMPIYQMEALA
ncbi:MAG: DUF885 domain-containing protein, partial [Halieaceae bacterium]